MIAARLDVSMVLQRIDTELKFKNFVSMHDNCCAENMN